MINTEILKLAESTRSWATAIADTVDPGDPRGWNSALENMCVMCSTYLAFKMYNAGYTDVQIVDAGIHTFVMLDNIVVDVTATQFGNYDEILVTEYENIRNNISTIFDNVSLTKTEVKPWNDEEYGLDKQSGIQEIQSMMKLHVAEYLN